MNLARRLAKLEDAAAPRRPKRFVVRFEGPGWEKLVQPTKEELDNATKVYTAVIVQSGEGTTRLN